MSLFEKSFKDRGRKQFNQNKGQMEATQTKKKRKDINKRTIKVLEESNLEMRGFSNHDTKAKSHKWSIDRLNYIQSKCGSKEMWLFLDRQRRHLSRFQRLTFFLLKYYRNS